MPGLREDDEDNGPDPLTAQDLEDDMDLDEADEDELAPDHPKGATDAVKRTVDDTTDGLGNSRPKTLRIHTLNYTLNSIETKRGLKTVAVNEDSEEKELIEKLKNLPRVSTASTGQRHEKRTRSTEQLSCIHKCSN
jgi:hypothetical protein